MEDRDGDASLKGQVDSEEGGICVSVVIQPVDYLLRMRNPTSRSNTLPISQ